MGEDTEPIMDDEPLPPLNDAALDHRARFASLNRSRPTDYMGGSKMSFREPPPAPIKINTGSSFRDNPFLKGNNNIKNATK
jgi:hypothetical protein